jgi:hypothetical protein
VGERLLDVFHRFPILGSDTWITDRAWVVWPVEGFDEDECRRRKNREWFRLIGMLARLGAGKGKANQHDETRKTK